jgi:hypothetical protein
MKLTLSLIMAVVIGLCFTPAWAQSEAMDESAGLKNQVQWITPQEFQRVRESSRISDWGYLADMELFDDGYDSDARWRSVIHLPDGAKIVNAQWYLFDRCGNDPDVDSIDVMIRKITPDPGGPTQGQTICQESSFTNAGYLRLDCDFTSGSQTVRNTKNYYVATIEFDTSRCPDRAQRLSGLKIVYKLQISPAPASHTFFDVPPTAQFFQEIEALAASGITLGCDGHNFCPDRYVTRGQMAAFLARALGLSWN